MAPIPALTIVSNNYLALARVLAESYRAQHPGARVFVCVVDRPAPEVDYAALPFETLFVADLGLPGFAQLAFRLNVLELNTAVKPFVLEELRTRFQIERVFYIDPDILVLAPLTGPARALERGAMVLTPHITAPIDDECVPSERTILMCGVYNLGFLGLRLDASTEAFLRWWQARLQRFCLHDVDHGLFVDQSWMDLAPAFLPDVQVLREPVYNVAYWNLGQRFPRQVHGRWELEGQPLAFFHFSGLPFEDLARVSRYQDRIHLRERPELRPLFEDYRARVLAAGHERLRELAYAFASLEDGRPIAPIARRVLQRVDPLGERWANPFQVGPGSFAEWLSEPLHYRGGVLNRALISLWEERPELQRRFPDVFGGELADFVTHARAQASALGLTPALVEGLGGASARDQLPRAGLPRGQAQIDVLEFVRRGGGHQPGALRDWLNEPAGDLAARPRLTRLALAVHALRGDVQRRYPDPLGADRVGFAYWLATVGARELDLDPAVVAPMRRTLPLRSRVALALRDLKRNSPLPPGEGSGVGELRPASDAAVRGATARDAQLGVNLLGHFESPTGVGQVARGFAQAAQGAALPTTLISLDADPRADLARGLHHPRAGAAHPLTLVCANADELGQALVRVPAAVHASGWTIGYWFWELAHFPLEFAPAFALVDEVWAPSQFCFEAFRALATVPVRLVPPCVPVPGATEFTREDLLWNPGSVIVLSLIDVRSVPERKHPEALLAALAQVAVECPALRLELVVSHADEAPEFVTRLRTAAEGLPVSIVAGTLRREEIDARLRLCDAYASLHRAEGLGLPLIEALSVSKPVIATAYGGVLDFLDESTGFPVPGRLVPLEHDLPPYPRGACWAEPDVLAAASALRALVLQPDEARRRAERGRARVEQRYGLAAAQARLRAECERLLREGPRW